MSLNGTSIVTTSEPLSTSQRRGAIVVAVVALLSALALAFIALRTIRLAMMLFLKRDNGTSRPPEILFFRTQLGHYAGCLILSNMFISAAGLIDFSWVSRSGLSRGLMCSAQAVLMQIGIWGTCWFTAAHGVHTLSSLGFHIRPARWRSSVGVALGWTIACVAGLVPLWKSNVYGPTGISCSIASSYPKEILVLEALPIILGASVSTAVYSAIFIVLHGKLSVNNTQKLRGPNSTSQRGEDRFEEYYKFISMIIRTMFWWDLPFTVTGNTLTFFQRFPLAFVFLLLPFCITHILMYVGHSVPSTANVIADVCASMLGFVNVVLLCNTFRVIGPVYHAPPAVKIVAKALKTFRHDASGESLIVPQPAFCPQSAFPSYESSHQTHNPTQSSSNHLNDSFGASVDSNTELFNAEQAPRESTRTGVARMVLNDILPPAELSRYPRIISPQRNTKRREVNFQSKKIIHSPPRTATLGPRDPRVPFVTENIRHEPSDSSNRLAPQRLSARSCMTVATVWSQATGYTMSQSPDAESQEAYRQLVANAPVPGVVLGNQADVGRAVSRQAAPPDPHAHPKTFLRSLKSASKLSDRVTNILSPKSHNSGPSTMKYLPNDSIV
ncbi:hypothetical protein J3R83DRAFT_12335 [Lanmaoa asiatica]|nr:hypothetical protein J3R83DRAFT_12335 [Lanmaoa asiatica]